MLIVKLKHWFWHVIAMMNCCDFYNANIVTDEEFNAYQKFMKFHGFDNVP